MCLKVIFIALLEIHLVQGVAPNELIYICLLGVTLEYAQFVLQNLLCNTEYLVSTEHFIKKYSSVSCQCVFFHLGK